MKRILNKIWCKTYKDNRGLSLVEVLCAVAILALVTSVIGSVIVISTRTYRRGISETNIQQEAQLAANNIGNIVKDACSVIYGESGAQYIKNGSEPMVNESDGSAKMQTAGFTELSIITNEKIQYTMTYDESNKKLLYQEYNTSDGSARTNPEIMATNIVDFKADTTDFEDSKTIKLSMKVEDSDTNRSIPMEYTMTSRNGDGEGGEYVTNTDSVVIIFLEEDVVLVPGETYQIPLSVTGKLNEGGLDWDSVTGLETVALTMDYAEVKVPIDSDGSPASFTVKTKDKDADGNPKDKASCDVFIRKVNSVAVSHSIDTKDSRGGMLETAGTVYTFNANVGGSELTKHVAYAYDSNYKTAQAVVWSWILTVDGVTCKREFTCTPNAGGQYEFAFTDDNQAKFDEYISVTLNKEDAIIPQLIMKIEKDMPADFVLTVRATSKHALGVNKADSQYYGEVADPKDIYYGEDVVKPRETILNQNLAAIILEPKDTGTVALGMKGGLTSNVEFECHDSSDPNTTVEYLPATDEAKITLGKNERGSGANGADPYTFTIDVKIGGTVKTTITVHVRRVDTVHIDAHINDKDKTTMDLRLRFNADTEVDNIIQYLIDAEDKNEAGEPFAYKAVTTRVTIEVLDKNNKADDSLTQIAEWGTYEGVNRDKSKESGIIKKVKGKWDKDLKRNGKTVYRIENTKPARISHNGTMWNMEQTPELDIKPMSLGLGEKIRVTMEAMHPAGTNHTGEIYYDTEPVKDVYILEGQEIIGVAKKNGDIIVEPYQVSDKNKAMIIPLYLAPSVKAIQVKLNGNDSNTRVLVDGKPDTSSDGNAKIIKPDDGNNVMNLGVNISRTEEGSTFNGKAGRIEMTITAYSETDFKEGNKLDSIVVYLGVRRVTEVTIKNKDAFENKAGDGMITLKAEATGLQGTEYFDRQVRGNDEKYEPVWDSTDKYKNPYKLRWTLRLKDGKETEINNKSEYFSDVSFGADGDKHESQTIKFKLKKTLPIGAQIRAISMHAGNKDGKAENRSELNYVKDIDKYKKAYPEGIVFDYIEVKSSLIVASGFQRANEHNYTFIDNIPKLRDDFFKGDKEYIIDGVKKHVQCEQRSFYRYREVDGNWSQYYKTDDNEEYHAYVTGERMGRLFRPDKEYELEIVNVLYNTSDKKIYWPQDEELLEPGRGWKEAGYSLQKWDTSIMTSEQKSFEYKRTYLIPKTEIFFDKYIRGQWDPVIKTVDGLVSKIGSETEPLQLYKEDTYIVNYAPTAFTLHAGLKSFTATLEKKVDGKWVKVDRNNMQNTENWFLQTNNPYVRIGYNYGASGLYRISSIIEKMDWKNVTGTDIFNPVYVTSEEDTPLFDASGAGIIYVQFNK